MSTSATPYGLRPISHNSADARPKAIDGGIASGYASAIYQNSPVTLSSNGTLIAVGAATDKICGMFVGCRYKPDSTSLWVESQYWPAAQTYVAGTMTAWIIGYDDPQVLYKIQSAGSLTQASIGDQVNMVNFNSGINQFSIATVSSGLQGAGNTGQLRILDVYPAPNNSWGDSYTEVIVQISAHQFYPQATAI